MENADSVEATVTTIGAVLAESNVLVKSNDLARAAATEGDTKESAFLLLGDICEGAAERRCVAKDERNVGGR